MPLSVTGVCLTDSGGFGAVEVTFNIQFEPGWNYLLGEVTAAEGTVPSALSLSTIAEPLTNVQWDYLPLTTSFSNKMPTLRLHRIR